MGIFFSAVEWDILGEIKFIVMDYKWDTNLESIQQYKKKFCFRFLV